MINREKWDCMEFPRLAGCWKWHHSSHRMKHTEKKTVPD